MNPGEWQAFIVIFRTVSRSFHSKVSIVPTAAVQEKESKRWVMH